MMIPETSNISTPVEAAMNNTKGMRIESLVSFVQQLSARKDWAIMITENIAKAIWSRLAITLIIGCSPEE